MSETYSSDNEISNKIRSILGEIAEIEEDLFFFGPDEDEIDWSIARRDDEEENLEELEDLSF